MKKLLNERVLFFLIFAFLIILVINASQKEKKYFVFNSNDGKLYRYKCLQPDEKYTWEAQAADSISILTRLIITSEIADKYSYEVIYNGQNKTITRNIKPSKESRGINGDKVTSLNKYKFLVAQPHEKIVVVNTSGQTILVKIISPKNRSTKSYKTDTEYIAYPPDQYDERINILVKDNEYSYYQGKYNGIALQLEGPLRLKIINRLIIDDTDKLSFSWKALIDGQEVLYVDDILPYSQSCLADSSSKVTQGKINILEIPDGRHKISIFDLEPQGIIYNLYISKPAIGN